MKKYFEIELRIGNAEEINFINRYYYFGNGALSIENGKIEGYISYDYLTGNYDGHMLLLQLYDFNSDEVMAFCTNLEEGDFTLPNTFAFKSSINEEEYAILSVGNKTAPSKEEYIQEARKACEPLI